ncbi:uncharacterized protein LOC143276554 isoform X1 [Babylonia areolata]|uniref:uncharacterized protein LOC143276554 isoform X1 n=1 Tax=Babylonia areolata TaxID=304850 RepID=UPI003FD41BC4
MDVEQNSFLNNTDERNDTKHNSDNDSEQGTDYCSDMDDTESVEPAALVLEHGCCVSRARCFTTSSLPGCIMSTGSLTHASSRGDNHTSVTTNTTTATIANTQFGRQNSDVPSVDCRGLHTSQSPSHAQDTVHTDRHLLEESHSGLLVSGHDPLCSKHPEDLSSVSDVSAEAERSVNNPDDDNTDSQLHNDQSPTACDSRDNRLQNEASVLSTTEDSRDCCSSDPETERNAAFTRGHRCEEQGRDQLRQSCDGRVVRDLPCEEEQSRGLNQGCEESQELNTITRNVPHTQSTSTKSSPRTTRPTLVCRRRGGKPRKVRFSQIPNPAYVNGSDVVKTSSLRADVINTQCHLTEGSGTDCSATKDARSSDYVSDTSCGAGDRRRAAKRPFICTIEVDAIIRILQQCDLLH